MIAIEVQGIPELVARLGMAPAELTDVVRRANKEIAAEIKADFATTTATWQHQPRFEQRTRNEPTGSAVTVGTADPVYRFLDEGTRPHGIQPKKPGGVLRFQWGGPGSYQAKTTPGVFSSGQGGPSGPLVARRWVWHPGTRPRFWSVLLQRKWETAAPVVLRRYVAAWIRRARA
jgi:hypothetical protein